MRQLRDLRSQFKLSQEDVAKIIGTRQEFVSKVERAAERQDGSAKLSESHASVLAQYLKDHHGLNFGGHRSDPQWLSCSRKTLLKDAPPELCEAFDCYVALGRLDSCEHIYSAAKQNDLFYLIRFPYSDQDDGFQSLQSTVYDCLQVADIGSGRSFRPVRESEFASTEFDAMRWTAIAERHRVCYAFPFFLPQSRRLNWFTLRYGTHKRVGLMLSKGTTAEENVEWSPADFNKALDSLVNTTGKLIAVEGWAESELLQAVIARCPDPALAEDILPRIRPVFPRDLKRGVPGDLADSDIFLYDLASRAQVEAFAASNDRPCVDLAHGLDFPVGVGFNLAMLPSILLPSADNCNAPWENILSRLKSEVFSNPSYSEYLRAIGVHLDAQFQTAT